MSNKDKILQMYFEEHKKQKVISDYAFAKWNRSIYNYDKNSSDLMLKKNICVSIDVPKRVRNVVNPCYIKTTN